MSREAWITTIVSMGLCLASFGLGVATILTIPGLGAEAQLLLPVVVLVGLLVAPYVACALTLKLSAPRQKEDEKDQLRPNVSSSRMMSSSPR